MTAVIPSRQGFVNFVGLVNGVNGFLYVPKTMNRVSRATVAWTIKTYWFIDTLLPMPPNSPWKPIRLGSYGLELIE